MMSKVNVSKGGHNEKPNSPPPEPPKGQGGQEVFGKVLPKDALVLRRHLGEAIDDEEGITYTLATNVGNGQPLIHSSKTGLYWTVSWPELIGAAVDAGIDKEQQAKE